MSKSSISSFSVLRSRNFYKNMTTDSNSSARGTKDKKVGRARVYPTCED